MTYINNNHVQHNNENRSRRSHSHHAARRSGSHFSESMRSRRSGRGGSSRRDHVRSQMSRMGHHQSQQLHTRRQGRHQQNQMSGQQFQSNNSQNGFGSINQLLQGFGLGNGSLDQLLQGFGNGNGSIDQLLQGFGSDNGSLDQLLQGFGNGNGSLDQLLQGFGAGNGSLDQLLQGLDNGDGSINQLLQGLGVSSDEATQLLDQISNDSNPVSNSNNMGNTDPAAEIQSLLQGFDMGEISSLLGMVSSDELSSLLQQESGMNVSADEITQLLQQLGLSTGTDTNTNTVSNPMPVEPDNGIGDGAGPIPTTPNTESNDPLTDIQSLLQGLDMGEIGSLLEMISPDDLAQMLQQESGLDVSATDIAQLLQQLGLDSGTNTSNDMVSNPMPVEPNNGIGNGADPIPTTTPAANDSSTPSDVQSLLQTIDPDDISALLETISPEQLAEMLQQQSGLTVSAEDIANLLQQIQQDSNNTGAPSNPIPVEPDNGIGDGAGPIPTETTDNSNTPSDVQSLLQTIDPDDISALLETISPEQLAEMLQQQSGLTVSAEDIANLLQQIQQNSNNTDTPITPMPVEPDNGIGDGAGPIPMMPDTGNTDPSAELQSLLSGLDMGEISSLLEMISPDDLAQMLQQESGLDVSADEIAQLLQQLGLDSSSNTSNDMVSNPINPMPVEPDNGIGDGADPMPSTDSIDPMAEIQSLLQGIDMGEISSLLQMISPDDLAQMLQQESGMNVSAADIAQLLQQLGLTAGMSTNNTMPAESHNDMSMNDSGDTTPSTSPATTAPVITNDSNVSTDAQALLQTIDPDDISLLLETISPQQLAEMLQQESGLTVSAEDIDQLLQQIQQNNDDMVSNTPMPVEPDNGIGDGAPDLGDLLADTTPAPATTPQEPSQQPAEMAIEPAAPMTSTVAPEADNSSPDVGTATNEPTVALADIDNSSQAAEVAAATGEIQSLLQQLDTSQFSSFFDLFSADQLAEMLTQEGTSVSAEEVQALLSQIGLSS
ncbi:MAG: hypothetical protein V3U78_02080 [Thiotrichaceae bacterium]